MSDLEINRRSIDVPNSAKKARKNGKVPGVLYGKAIKNLLFEVGELELAHEVARNGQHGVLDFCLDGEKHKGLIKEVQKDPVTNNYSFRFRRSKRSRKSCFFSSNSLYRRRVPK